MSKRSREEAYLDELLEECEQPQIKKRKTTPLKKSKKRELSPTLEEETAPVKKKLYNDLPTPTSHQPPEDTEEVRDTGGDKLLGFEIKLKRTSELMEQLFNDVSNITNKLSIGQIPIMPSTLTKILLKLKSHYRSLSIDFGGDIKKALITFKQFWGTESFEDLVTISERDNFKKIFQYVLKYVHDLEFKVKQGIGKSLMAAKHYIKVLKGILKLLYENKQDKRYITVVEHKIENMVNIIQKVVNLVPIENPDKINPYEVQQHIKIYEELYELERMIPIKLRGLGKDLDKINIVPICSLKYTFIERGIQPNVFIYYISGRIGYSFKGKENIVFSKTDASREKESITLFDFKLSSELLNEQSYMFAFENMQEYISTNSIFDRITENVQEVLPFDIGDETLKNDPTNKLPLTIMEILELANYQTPIDGDPIYTEDFYKHYKRRTDSNQEIEPGIKVVIFGNYECPPMSLNMAVKMRNCVTVEEMELAKKSLDLVVDHIDYGHNGNLLILDMTKAPKNRYREYLEKSDSYYHHLYQWFITINPNMTHTSMATSVRGESLLNTKEEFYELVKNTFSAYIPEWLIFNKRPLEPEKVRSWKIEEMKEESGGGAGRLAHIHLLLSVSILSDTDLERSVNLSYTEINKYFQSIRKQTYFNCQKVNIDKNGILDNSSTNRQRVIDYINKGEKPPSKYNFSRFTKPKDTDSP